MASNIFKLEHILENNIMCRKLDSEIGDSGCQIRTFLCVYRSFNFLGLTGNIKVNLWFLLSCFNGCWRNYHFKYVYLCKIIPLLMQLGSQGTQSQNYLSRWQNLRYQWGQPCSLTIKHPCVWILPLPFSSCVTVDKLLNLFESSFSYI